MSLKTFLWQFTLIYIGLSVVVAAVLMLTGLALKSSINTAVLLAAVMWACLRFAKAHRRYFTAAEKRSAFFGMLAIDVGLQALVAGGLMAGLGQAMPWGALGVGLLFVSALHAVVIWLFIGFAGKQVARHAQLKEG